MAIELELNNLYNYIQSKHTDNTVLFKQVFSTCIDRLPNYTCSSKIIYQILREYTDIHTNSIKQQVFRDTFNEYFKWKLLG